MIFEKSPDNYIDTEGSYDIFIHLAWAKNNGVVATYNIESTAGGMYGPGTPDDLNYFLSCDVCKKALASAV